MEIFFPVWKAKMFVRVMKIRLIFIASRNPEDLMSRIEFCGTSALSYLKKHKTELVVTKTCGRPNMQFEVK